MNFGIIGCGSIAAVHAEAIKNIKNANLVACCDIDINKGKYFAKTHFCRFYASFQELLQDDTIDVVTIATPHFLHAKMAIMALNNKKNVICEKPMAINMDEAQDVIEAIKNSDCQYTVCYQNRFNPAMIELKKKISNSQLGQLHGASGIVTWHRDANYYNSTNWKGRWSTEGGGVLINQAIHTIDEIYWLAGMPAKIKGKIMTSSLDDTIEVEDSAMATGLLPNSIPIVIFASNDYSSDPQPQMMFDFELAKIKLSANSLYINNEPVLINRQKPKVGKNYWGIGHQKLFETFIDKIVGHTNALTNYLPCIDAAQSLEIVRAIYESDRTDSWVKLNNYVGENNW
ncbi:MAG: Gfo/Idh/MocA family oxidoreductase [Lactobacillaceae bacterium]|jgi:predicted dehydrogenase|nr:Gfo/Idh/MocA family oxidoreductase [Lactobacillaceae bacterium]